MLNILLAAQVVVEVVAENVRLELVRGEFASRYQKRPLIFGVKYLVDEVGALCIDVCKELGKVRGKASGHHWAKHTS